MAFKIGQKMVCIKSGSYEDLKVIKGEIYTCAGYSPIRMGEVLIKEFQINKIGYVPYLSGDERRFKPLELDMEFVEEVIKQVKPQKQEICNTQWISPSTTEGRTTKRAKRFMMSTWIPSTSNAG